MILSHGGRDNLLWRPLTAGLFEPSDDDPNVDAGRMVSGRELEV